MIEVSMDRELRDERNQVKGISDLRTYQQMQEKERKKRPIVLFSLKSLHHIFLTQEIAQVTPQTQKLQLSYVVLTNAHDVVLQP
jgi:hypothetical protein